MSLATDYYRNIGRIDEALSKNVITEQIYRFLEEKPYANYFFNTVTSLSWFFPLKERGYFTPQSGPRPMPADEKGHITVPQWNVLPYLERISKQVREPGNEKYIGELLDIMRDVTQYHIRIDKDLANYHTWTYFVRILVNIPNSEVPSDIVKLIHIWLDSQHAGSAMADDLALELLPKFLADLPSDGDIEKAEIVFESLFEIRWKEGPKDLLEKLGGVREEAYLVVDQHWLAESLINKKYAQKVGEKCSGKPVYMLADKLKSIFRREHNPSSFDVSIDAKMYRVIVNHTSDFQFSCFGGIIDDEVFSEVKDHEKAFRKMLYVPDKQFEFILENCRDSADFADLMIHKLGESCQGDMEDEFRNRMEDFYDHIMSDYSYIWYKYIADPPQYLPTDAKKFIAYILHEIILAKVEKDEAFGGIICKDFLGDKYQYAIFGRMALHIVSEYWNRYKSVFYGLLDSKVGELMFEDVHYEVELYTLLEENLSDMDDTSKSQLSSIIGNGPKKQYFDEKNKEKYSNLWRQKWYSALKADKEFAELYDEYFNLTKTKEYVAAKEPEFRMRSGPGPSPLSVEDILSMSNSEIALHLDTFETKDRWEDPTEDALSDELKKSVKTKPDKFVEDMSPFLNLSYKYVIDILWGVRDAWKNKSTFDWGKLFVFIRDYIDREEFWQDRLPKKGDYWKPNHPWVISMIGSLIQDGTADDDWAFDECHNAIALGIITIILTDEHIDNLKARERKSEPDFVSDLHNTPLGDSILALLNLSLRMARLKGKEQKADDVQDVRWDRELRRLYEKTFANDIVEAFTAFGQYLPNLMYLDKKWTEQKTKDLIEPKHPVFREAFMTGYLNTITLYDDIYLLESMQDHYEWALESGFVSHTVEQLVHHISIGYLRGHVDLFHKMYKKWIPLQILETINFFWRESKYLLKPDAKNRGEVIKRILNFWQVIYDRYKDKGDEVSEDDRKTLSAVIKLAVYIDEIDRTRFDWLMLSAPHVYIEGNERWLLEFLDSLKDRGENKVEVATYVLQVVLKTLESRVFWFAQEFMKSIIDYAYGLGDPEVKDMANKICNTLGTSGVDYLRSTYEKYNS